MKKAKKIPVSISRKVVEINEMFHKVKDGDDIPCSYFGGTWPTYIIFEKEMDVVNQFVYIHAERSSNNIESQRFNTNNEDQLDELKYNLRYIRAAFKSLI